MTISKNYRTPLLRNAAAQGIVLLLGGMLTDSGFLLFPLIIAAVAYWVTLIIVIARHPTAQQRGDLIWADAGFAIVLAVAFVIGPIVVYWRGH